MIGCVVFRPAGLPAWLLIQSRHFDLFGPRWVNQVGGVAQKELPSHRLAEGRLQNTVKVEDGLGEEVAAGLAVS